MRHYLSLPKEGVIFSGFKEAGKKNVLIFLGRQRAVFSWWLIGKSKQAFLPPPSFLSLLVTWTWLFGLPPNEALGETLQDERDSGGSGCHGAIKNLTF